MGVVLHTYSLYDRVYKMAAYFTLISVTALMMFVPAQSGRVQQCWDENGPKADLERCGKITEEKVALFAYRKAYHWDCDREQDKLIDCPRTCDMCWDDNCDREDKPVCDSFYKMVVNFGLKPKSYYCDAREPRRDCPNWCGMPCQ